MPHSSNVAGKRAAKRDIIKVRFLSLFKKRARRKKPTPHQLKTLFGRKSMTERFIGDPLFSPHSRAKSAAMGVRHPLNSIETPVPGTTEEISPLLYIATTAAMSPITIRTHNKKASPHSRSKQPRPTQPTPTASSMQLRSRCRMFNEYLCGNKELNSTSENIFSSPLSDEEKQPVTIQQPTIASEEKTLSPEITRKAKQIPAVANPIKVYTERVWLKDVIEAEDTARRYPTEVFCGLKAQELAYSEETNVDDTCYEYLHLLAHSFGGDFSRPNIVIGSRDANTIMTLYDHAAKYLLEKNMCNYIDIKIECTLKPRKDGSGFTHHAKEIKLRYETDDGFIFYSPTIDGDSIERPTVQMGEKVITLLTQYYSAYKTTLANTKDKPAVQESSILELPLYTEKPDPKQKSLFSYFTSESKETTAAPQKPSRKRKRKNDTKTIPNYKITTFFPATTENQENCFSPSQALISASSKPISRNSNAFFIPSSKAESIYIPAIPPSIRAGI